MRSRCKSCGEPILWARTEKGVAIPIDAQQVIDGNVQLIDDPSRVDLIARVGAAGSGQYRSHFASCSAAAAHRRSRRPSHT